MRKCEVIFERTLSGAADADIAEVCRQEERVIMTLDTDFADIRAYPPEDFFGIIVLRLKRQDKSYVLSVVKRLVSVLQKEPVIRNLWIVEEDRVRISGKENL
ncbi:MAG: DUF5615 family PIN-like protein [Proteobacteria bacterium]|nr:DUF5615 family PIN-like protein [Pseudomonadota bacterium]